MRTIFICAASADLSKLEQDYVDSQIYSRSWF